MESESNVDDHSYIIDGEDNFFGDEPKLSDDIGDKKA